MVSLKRENDVNNNNNNIRSWIGKMFHDPGRNLDRSSANNDDPTASGSAWDKNLHEIENYFQQLLSLNLEEEEDDENLVEEEEEVALDVLQHMVKILSKEPKNMPFCLICFYILIKFLYVDIVRM